MGSGKWPKLGYYELRITPGLNILIKMWKFYWQLCHNVYYKSIDKECAIQVEPEQPVLDSCHIQKIAKGSSR